MRRSGVAFRPEVQGLEKRALQTRAAVPYTPPPPAVNVTFNPPLGSPSSNLQFTQQSGSATVELMRSGMDMTTPVQVRVTTDPSSPYVGVNVGAVDQVVSFDQGQDRATVTVPILAGAPNPGEVDVSLSITPIDPPPNLSVSAPLTLRIMASDALIPPRIISENGTPNGIELTFNKPMDPVQATNVNNYTVTSTTVNMYLRGGLIGWAMHGLSGSTTWRNVPLKAATYNADTNTVTLVPRRHLSYPTAFGGITVREGHPRRGGSGGATGLVDLYGNPIDQATTPGKFRVSVMKGLTRFPSA